MIEMTRKFQPTLHINSMFWNTNKKQFWLQISDLQDWETKWSFIHTSLCEGMALSENLESNDFMMDNTVHKINDVRISFSSMV